MTVWSEAFAYAVRALGLSPDAFWRLTLAEWRALAPPAAPAMSPERLAALLRLYPDEPPCQTM